MDERTCGRVPFRAPIHWLLRTIDCALVERTCHILPVLPEPRKVLLPNGGVQAPRRTGVFRPNLLERLPPGVASK